MSKTTAIYVRRSVSDADKGNNSLSIAAQREEFVACGTAEMLILWVLDFRCI